MPVAKAKTKIDPARKIGLDSLKVIWQHKNHFAIILFFYAVAYLFAVTTVTATSSGINSGSLTGLSKGISTYFSLIGSLIGTNSPISGAYQLVLFISLSLVIIWSLKAFQSKKKIMARDAFYKASTPLIPFFLILLLIGVEFIPLLIAAGLYNIVIVNHVAVLLIEKVIWFIIFGLLGILSLYLATSSTMALYTIAAGNSTPMQALRSARALVKGRRTVIFGKILFLPVALTIIIGIIMLPIILIVPSAAQRILFLISLIALLITHSYMFRLNQEVSK